jgi:hypothetical protein
MSASDGFSFEDCLPSVNVDAHYFYLCGVPVGAIASAVTLFRETAGLITGPLEAVVSCIGTLIGSLINPGSTGSSGGGPGNGVRYSGSGGGAGWGGGLCAPEIPEIEGLVIEAEGVCAQVRVRIDQEAVTTRAAFAAVLELTNGHQTASLEGVLLTIVVRDENGNVVNDRFTVVPPELVNINAVDGTGTR